MVLLERNVYICYLAFVMLYWSDDKRRVQSYCGRYSINLKNTIMYIINQATKYEGENIRAELSWTKIKNLSCKKRVIIDSFSHCLRN